ncbi:haloacid dehalogenase [Streptomyces sp. 150FB]|uniref:HAD-IA family hydrolase n=1 Tax=Streptomyces sp. 150FB TaxID=1576605 RepID=UPI00058957C0|nr:HAD-IA family hydrolase [Streptomyces sp. 150FB]KIF74917.1 haloacid dehalogenase [Streptomyces sp. 150FB]
MPQRTCSAGQHVLRGLILDFAGVLTADPRPAHRAWAESEGLHADAWGAALGGDPEGRRLYSALEVGLIGQAEWNAGTATLLGAHVDPANLMGRAWSAVPAARQMAALARAAKEAGYQLALLSNSFGLDPFNPYEHADIWDLFDVHVISEVVGMAKPDPAIYQLTLDRLGLSGEACVFVDDHSVNLPPAKALGITPVLATHEADTVAALEGLLGVTAARAGQPKRPFT